MIAKIVGCGDSGENWFEGHHDLAIGVNDAIKHGRDFDYLIIVNSFQSFKKEPERIKLIESSKAKVLTNGDTWRGLKYEKVRLTPFGKYLKKGTLYCSKSSPFIGVSLAFNLGATDIILYGVDMKTHPLFSPGKRSFDYEMRQFHNFCTLLSKQGVRVWVSSAESSLSKFLNVWGA